jgi:chromosome segregation ATPase
MTNDIENRYKGEMTVGECQMIYNDYGLRISLHTHESTLLCEVIADLQKQVEASNAFCDAQENARIDAENKYAELKSSNELSESLITDYRSKLDEAKDEIGRLRKSIETTSKDYVDMMELHKATTFSLGEKNSKLTEENCLLSAELHTVHQNLQTSYRQAREDAEVVADLKERCKKEFDIAHEKIEQWARLKIENEALSAKHQRLVDGIGKLETVDENDTPHFVAYDKSDIDNLLKETE